LKNPKHYIDNAAFQEAMVSYHRDYVDAIENNKELPPIPRFVAECFMKISTHLAFRPNFANYTFRDEMISDGIEVCCKYIHNYNPNKYNNPHAYFTTAVWRAFVQRINLEKAYLYKKHVATQIAELNDNMSDSQEQDTRKLNKNDYGEWSQEQMQRFMEEFESKRGKRKKKILDKGTLNE